MNRRKTLIIKIIIILCKLKINCFKPRIIFEFLIDHVNKKNTIL